MATDERFDTDGLGAKPRRLLNGWQRLWVVLVGRGAASIES